MDRKITITMTTGNEGFQTDYNVIAVLMTLAKELEMRGVIESRRIRDVNGNTIGTIKVEEV